MRKIVIVLLFVLLTTIPSLAAVIEGGAWAEFYAYKVKVPTEVSHLRSLEGLRLGVKDAFIPGLSVFARGRVASDISHKLPGDTDFRVYGAYLEYATPQKWLTARAGRQFVFAGLGGLTLDGGKIDLKHKSGIALTGYAGTTPGPTFFDFDEVNTWKKSNAYGGRLKYSGVRSLVLGVSFQQRNFNDNLDSQLGGFDVSYSKRMCNIFGRTDYDFFFKRLQLATVRPTIRFTGGHYVSLEYLYRYRSLPLHSMFSVFNSEPYNQFRVSPVVKLMNDLYGLGTLTYTKYKGDNNVRFSLGASYQGQSLGIHFGDGYGGKQIGGFGNLSYSPMKDLELYLHGDLFGYKIDKDDTDYLSSLAGAFGGYYTSVKNLRTRAEVQLLSNNDYRYDTRFYLRLEYSLRQFVNETIGGDGR